MGGGQDGAASTDRGCGQRRLDVDMVYRGLRRADRCRCFDIRIEDQDHSARLLREGVVMGAVTTERKPAPGCRGAAVGRDALLPVASGAYVERYLPDGFTRRAVAEAPSLAWNRDDALQDMFVRKSFGRAVSRPTHFVPTAEGFAGRRCVRAWAGACFPSNSPLLRLDGRVVRADSRRAARCAAFLAVLEVGQPDGRAYHSSSLVSCRRSEASPDVAAWSSAQRKYNRSDANSPALAGAGHQPVSGERTPADERQPQHHECAQA